MQLETTASGVRLRHGVHLVSWLPAQPGPTNSVFDVLTAAAIERGDPSSIALLGFAVGGCVAPLRALGSRAAVHAVDLDTRAEPAFRRVAGTWAGEVHLAQDDAHRWLLRSRRRFPVIIEDLSMAVPGDVTKPPVSYEKLPELMSRRLTPDGLVVVNLLPVASMSWATLERTMARPFPHARVVSLSQYDNRILVGSASPLPEAANLRRSLDTRLTTLGSRLAGTLSVRTRRVS